MAPAAGWPQLEQNLDEPPPEAAGLDAGDEPVDEVDHPGWEEGPTPDGPPDVLRFASSRALFKYDVDSTAFLSTSPVRVCYKQKKNKKKQKGSFREPKWIFFFFFFFFFIKKIYSPPPFK